MHLEFAPGAQPAARLGWALFACSLAVLLAIAVALVSVWSAHRRERLLLAEVQARQSQVAMRTQVGDKPDPAYLARVKSAQLAAKSLNAPWADLLDAIESAPQQSVALLAMEPSAARHSMRLTAEARDLQAMLAYLAALQEDRRLASTVLVSHQVQVQAPGQPIRFQIQAGWGTEP